MKGSPRNSRSTASSGAISPIVAGVPIPAKGTIDAPLARSAANRKKIAVVEGKRGKRAVTHYRIVRPLKEAALVECRLETGRTHQVRVHMASIGHPLLGDPVYGRPRAGAPGDIEKAEFSPPGAARRRARLRPSGFEGDAVPLKAPSPPIFRNC